jgi:hypothetical protein
MPSSNNGNSKQNIHGDGNFQHIGNNYYNQDELNKMPLRRVVLRCIKEMENDKDYCGFIEKLASYMTEVSGPIIGLEEKLKKGNRLDLLENALLLKESFAKCLTREQLAPSMQEAYVHILSCIRTIFFHKVRPLIQTSTSSIVIDKAIYDDIVMSIYTQISDIRELNHTMDDILGMLYFLTGNCHINWE